MCVCVCVCVVIECVSTKASSCRAANTESQTLSRHFSLSAGLQGYIPYSHIAAECMFVLVVLLLHGHVWGSIRVHLL